VEKFNASVGQLVRSFAAFDFGLCLLLAELMETNFETALTVSAALDFSKKQKLISSLSSIKLPHMPKLRKQIEEIQTASKGMSRERNRVAHGVWFGLSDGKTELMTIGNNGTLEIKIFKKLSPNHFHNKANEISTLTNKLPSLSIEVSKAISLLRKVRPPLIPPHLATS
jgi:hypothetical protein